MSSISKINQLPGELLALIYATSLRDLPSDQHQPLLTLIGSVCRRWRDVAIGASELWTTIYIALGRHLPATQAFLERSKGRLIDVFITAVNTDRFIIARDAATITAITVPHISRVRTLVMSLPQYKVYTTFSDAYRSISPTNLAGLSFHFSRDIWQTGAVPPLFANADSLCHFDTQGNFLNIVPSRTSLGNYMPTHKELQDLFNCSPRLETLILHSFDIIGPLDLDSEADVTPMTITAPTSFTALALNLHRPHSDSTTLCCVLGSLCIPNLQYLELVGTSVLGVDIDLKVHFGQLDKLRKLRIQHCTVSPPDEEFLLSLKDLRRLELVDMSPEDIRHIIAPPSSSFSFPRLSSVFFSTTGGHIFSPYRLLQLAQRCVAAGCPSFTLEVEKGCSGENFKGISESCFQDGRIRIIESDCSSGLIRQDDSDAEIDSRVVWDEGETDEEGWEVYEFEDDEWDEDEEDASEFDEEDQDGDLLAMYST